MISLTSPIGIIYAHLWALCCRGFCLGFFISQIHESFKALRSFFDALFSYFSADAVDVPLKSAARDKLGEDVLHKGGHGAGIKTELFLIDRHKMAGEHHISDAQGGRDRF